MKIHKAYPNEEYDHEAQKWVDAPGVDDHARCGHDLRGGLGRTGRNFSEKRYSLNWDEVTCKRCLDW